MFYVKRLFFQEKRHFLIQTIKGCAAFQAWVLVVFHTIFAKASAAWLANIHFVGWKWLIARRTFHNNYRLFLILFTAIIPKKNARYTLSEKAESYPQNRALKFTRRKNGKSRNKTIKKIKNSPKTQEKQHKTRPKQRFLFHVEQMWTTKCFARNI